jgi:hypothetical protein
MGIKETKKWELLRSKVTAKIVRVKLWLVTRRLLSSMMGMRWPIPPEWSDPPEHSDQKASIYGIFGWVSMWVGEIVIILKASSFAWCSKLRGISLKLRMLNGPKTREYVNVHEGLHVAFQCFKHSTLERNGGTFGKLELKNARAWHVGRLSLFQMDQLDGIPIWKFLKLNGVQLTKLKHWW